MPRQVHLYIDGSKSMKGFAEQDDIFHALLISLRPALLDLQIERSRITRVGGGLEPVESYGGFARYDARDFYELGETDLAEALDLELRQESPESVALFLTDGVMSLLNDTGEEGSLADCERGSDVQCLSYRIGNLVDAGYGVWIVGLRSAFRGTLYSEVLRPGGASLGEAEIVDRPFYLWVAAKHLQTGRTLVSRLLERLGVKSDGRNAFALEIAPGHVPWRVPDAQTAPASDSHLFPAGARSGAVTGTYKPAPSGGAGTQVVAGSDLEGTAFGLRIRLTRDALLDPPGGVAFLWRYEPSYCLRWQEPPQTIVRTLAVEDQDDLRLAIFSASFHRLAGHRATVVHRLVRQSNASEALPDLGAWSTTDDRTLEQGSRTLNLDEFLYALHGRLTLETAYEQPVLSLEFE